MKTAHFLLVFVSVSFFLIWCVFDFSYIMTCSGKLLLFAVVLIIIHSVFHRSVVSGRDCILLIYCRYAAVLCSVGWLNSWLIVVFVVVGFLYICLFAAWCCS